MKPPLKPLAEQVLVLTGASSGIGLTTARMAAERGAWLVLAARSEQALQALTEECRAKGTEAVYVVADVGQESEVRRIAETAIARFGGFDTWINNAAVSIFGKVEDVDIADQRRLFETNYWGVVYGSRIACEHLRHRGGVLINIGSVLSERAIPIQGVYSAAKAAVMGFTDALRMELEQDNAPVAVTLIKPGPINTPYATHAANYLDVEAHNPPPVYAPETVARAILHAAEHPAPEVVVGAGGKLATTVGNVAPRLSEKVLGALMPRLQRTAKSQPGTTRGSLYQPSEDLRERGDYPLTMEHSVYTATGRHKSLAAATAIAGGALLYRFARSRGRRPDEARDRSR